MLSGDVGRVCEKFLKRVYERCFKHNMDVCKVVVHLRVYLSAQALYGTTNALY